MKITHIDRTPVRVPRRKDFLPKTAHGEVRASEYVVLQLHTDAGLTGLGEVTCAQGWNGESAAETLRIVDDTVWPVLKGTDPTEWRLHERALHDSLRSRPFLRAGIEMATLDLVGKGVGVSIATLLGGRPDQSIPTKIVLPARDPATVAQMAERALELGAKSLKVKVGLDLATDIDRVRSVRACIGHDIPLVVDANEGWDLPKARAALSALATAGIRAVEQPLPRSDMEGTRTLRAEFGTPIVGDESVWGWTDIFELVVHDAVDVVSVYPGKSGGIRRAISMAEAAHALALGVTYGSNLELGIGAAAMAHAISASPPVTETMPSDLIGPLYFESSLITDPGFVDWSGAFVPPNPGLGVELDTEALAYFALAE